MHPYTILITGGLGEVGTALTQYLRLYNAEAVIVVTDTAPYALVDRCIYEPMDVTCPSDCAAIFDKYQPSIVYNLAAVCGRVISEIAKQRSLEVNVGGAFTIAQLSVKHGAKLVHISTSEVYGQSPVEGEGELCCPNNWYGLTKYQGEQVVAYIKPDAIVLRPFMIYSGEGKLGPNRSVLVRFVESILKGERIEVHIGSARSWLHLSDAARMIADAAHIKPGSLINIGNPEEPWDTEYLAQFIGSVLGKHPNLHTVPMPERMTARKRPRLHQMLYKFGEPKVSMLRGITQAVNQIKDRLS